MTRREMELFNLLVHYRKLYEDSNPEVGMGLSREMLANKLVEELSFDIDEYDIAEILKENIKKDDG